MRRKYYNSLLPAFAVCRLCGETASAGTGRRRCWQCCVLELPGYTHPKTCAVRCAAIKLPARSHHIASRRIYPALTAPLCLNCHRILYARNTLRRDGSAERASFAYLLVGVFDLLRLFADRSPAWEMCRQIFQHAGPCSVLGNGGAVSACAARGRACVSGGGLCD